MPAGKIDFPRLPPVPGVKIGTVGAGIKRADRDDMLVFELAPGSTTAGVFTQNDFAAAPVEIAKQHLRSSEHRTRYLVVNAGNANACTGEPGREDALAICRGIAEQQGAELAQVLPFSTGVIGERLPVDKMQNALPGALTHLQADNWLAAAKAIMTTDTAPKGATCQFEFNAETITVNGIAKGSGMIKPNMATLLAFMATDAPVAPPVVEQLVRDAAAVSFNRVVVDGDTSTNDAFMLSATGCADVPELHDTSGELYEHLLQAVNTVAIELAQKIVRDAEGATKFVTVEVEGGHTTGECAAVAYAVAQSPLVKTALFASDPNWGRIVVAIGYAGLEGLDTRLISVFLDDVMIVERGERAASYTEEAGQSVMDREDITIRILLGRGEARHHVWTSDFSHEYVRINAEYRT